jgi:hypothetical protein
MNGWKWNENGPAHDAESSCYGGGMVAAARDLRFEDRHIQESCVIVYQQVAAITSREHTIFD